MTTMDVVLAATLVLLTVVVVFTADMLFGTWRRRRRWFARHRAERDLMASVIDALTAREQVEAAAEAMRASDPAVAETVCLAAGRIVGEEQRAVLARLARAAQVNERARVELRSSRWWRRLRAVRLLHLASDDPADLRVLNDPHPEVRAAALLWLSDRPRQLQSAPTGRDQRRSGYRDATELLADALVSPVAIVRIAAKHVCVKVEPAPVWVLERALALATTPGAEPLAAVAPLTTLAALGRRVVLPLEGFLHDEAAEVRAAAIRAVAVGSPDRVPGLVREHLADADQAVRRAVAAIAGRHPAAAPVLLELARDPAWQVRQVARRSLLRAGPVGRALLRRLQQTVG